MEQKRIGSDLGFSQSKFSNLRRDILFKSVVGKNFDSMMPDFNHHGIVFDDPKVMIGEEATTYADDPLRHEDDKWIESEECRMLFLAGISQLYDGNGEIYAVCTLPINLYKTSKGKLTKNLERTHRFKRYHRDTQEIHVTVREIPQAFAVLCNEVLNESGVPVSPVALQRVGVIDIGGRTTNFLLTEKLRDIKHQSASINKGCWHMVRQLQQVLMQQFDRPNLSEYDVEQALFSSVLLQENVQYDIQEFRASILANFLTALITKIEQLWSDIQGIQKIFLAGGGSLLFEQELRHRYSQAALTKDPIHGNAKGAAKLAQRTWNPKG